MMSGIRGRNTKPELQVRQWLHRQGFRFRLHQRKLPGTPDIVLPKYGVVIFVHGCFWHRHKGCRFATTPITRAEFWREKLDANTARDARDQEMLRATHWRVIVIWECWLRARGDMSQVAAWIEESVEKFAEWPDG